MSTTIDRQEIQERLHRTAAAFAAFADRHAADLAAAAQLVLATYRAGGKVLIFGNGGSAAEAQHIAAELVCRMCFDRPPLAAVALTSDSSVVTSISNDYDFRAVFAKQVLALGRPGDLAWGLSTSGRSPNVIAALEAAGERKMQRLALAGAPGTPIGEVAELCLWVEAESTAIIQEIHLACAHIICAAVERELFGGPDHG
jgi:D-sedoheptulose 7-phosphate isomerase